MGYVQGVTGIAQVRTSPLLLQSCSAKTMCFILCILLHVLLQMVAALPAGWMADKYRRDYILKGAAALGAIAGASLAITLLYKLPVKVLFGACALLGTYTGFNNAPVEALFADCIPRGKRWGHWQAICLYHLTAMASAHCHEACVGMADFHAECTWHQTVHNAHVQQWYAHVTVLTYSI